MRGDACEKQQSGTDAGKNNLGLAGSIGWSGLVLNLLDYGFLPMYNAKSKKAIKKITRPNPSATFAFRSFGNKYIMLKKTLKAARKGKMNNQTGFGLEPAKAMALTKINQEPTKTIGNIFGTSSPAFIFLFINMAIPTIPITGAIINNAGKLKGIFCPEYLKKKA